MPDKAMADLEEMTDPNYDGIPGSNMDDCRIEQAEIELHNENLLSAYELDIARSLHEGFPEEFPDPCNGRICTVCEIGGCEELAH